MLPDIDNRHLTGILPADVTSNESDDDDSTDNRERKGLTNCNFNEKDANNAMLMLYFKICRKYHVTPVTQMVTCLTSRDSCLNVSYLHLSTNDFVAIFKILQRALQVNSLMMRSANLTKDVLWYLQMVLEKNEHIINLNLSHNKLNSSCHDIVAAIVGCTANLVRLNLSDTNMQDNDVKFYEKGLIKNRSILKLNLSQNKLGDQNGNILPNIILQNDCIEKLDLSWNNIRCSTACNVARAFQTNCAVQVLNLSFNGFGDMGAKELGLVLQKNKTLVELNIKDNRITNVGARSIGSGLAANNSLKVLDVSSNLITSGMNAILVGVIRNTSLKELYMTNISPDATCLKAIQFILERDPKFIIKHDKVCRVRKNETSGGEYVIKEEVFDRIRDHISTERLRMTDLFHIWDRDRSGQITIDEFINGLNSANIPVSKHMLEKVFEKLDKDQSGHIDYRQFARLARLM